MTTTYTAITIGPIIETLNNTRKTRELWGASYLFSYVIRETVHQLPKDDILLPYFEKNEEWENHFGAGLFPDRIFLKGSHDVRSVYQKVLSEIATKIESWFSNQTKIKRKLSSKEIELYLKSYFRFIEIHFECNSSENIIEIGSTLLDSRELQTNIVPEDEFVEIENPLSYFLYHINGSFLFDDGFNKHRPQNVFAKERFPSLIEIALKAFDQIDGVKYKRIEQIVETQHEKFADLAEEKKKVKTEEDIIEFAESLFPNQIEQSHKYIAIVQADGDKIGKMVAKVGNEAKKIRAFSQKLMEFSKTSTNIAVQYGGAPIYMGGDDLFFFAPLKYKVNNKDTTLFDMLNALDIAFQDIVVKYASTHLGLDERDYPSLSFGVSLSYYKFPLYEAKQMAFGALFEDIKWKDKRNAINLKFRKHSGQLIQLFINRNEKALWEGTIKFINRNLSADAQFLNSFTHKLRYQDEFLFSTIASDSEKLKAFFENNFNENYKKNETYYTSLQEFIPIVKNAHTETNDMKNYLYSVLRFIHFLRS